ncbi:DUF2798 domain-containing protein [Pedobacter sp. P351]|uniref:DUF2798 domain-containing protein n=1 Tax=Pedobacter superstes TaxID=3133441 RepID=UPI0030A4A6ED
MKTKRIKLIQTFFVVLPMTLIMAMVAIARNHGFENGWLLKVFHSWCVMSPVAYLAAFFIIPTAGKATVKVVSKLEK